MVGLKGRKVNCYFGYRRFVGRVFLDHEISVSLEVILLAWTTRISCMVHSGSHVGIGSAYLYKLESSYSHNRSDASWAERVPFLCKAISVVMYALHIRLAYDSHRVIHETDLLFKRLEQAQSDFGKDEIYW